MAKSDMFLRIEGARAGLIKGETTDAARLLEIDVDGWAWGLRAQTDMAGGGSAGKSSMRELLIRKKVDCASTALMAALRTNELIKSAVLTVRKAGKTPVDFFTITVEDGRITSLDVASPDDDAPEPVESLSISFQRVCVQYVPQGGDGAGGAAMLFEAETL